MKIKTKKGIAEPMPLSDLQRYNDARELLKLAIIVFGVLGFWLLLLISWIIWKVLSSGAINNYIAACV